MQGWRLKGERKGADNPKHGVSGRILPGLLVTSYASLPDWLAKVAWP